jgi:HAD superfamily hydrolase (TIGR01548 family)
MDILIFDMDGVLIDVSNSYRRTIQRTVQIYLETCLGFKNPRKTLITKEEISLFKATGGFNNDWDLTSGLITYLLSISGIPPSQKRKIFSSFQEIIPYLKTKSSKYPRYTTELLKKKNLPFFLRKVKSQGGGLNGIQRSLNASWDGWVYRSGEIDQENVVKRIFQEVYLGKKFTPYYHLQPFFYSGQGYYLQERLLIPKNILSLLRNKIHLGIASGRPRFEAELALKRFRLRPYFDSIVTLDECEMEEEQIFHSIGKRVKLSKPHPYSILRVIKEAEISNPQCGYVGDVVDDILAAKAAKKEVPMTAIGFLGGTSARQSQRESLLKAQADIIVKNPKELLSLFD